MGERESLSLILELYLQILKGVKLLHEHQITHYDLKCENIFIKKGSGESFQVFIGDFGESSLSDPTNPIILQNKGTEYIKAPELHL